MDLFGFTKTKPKKGTTCRTCEHRQRWKNEYSRKVLQYCGISKSNRTSNGLKRVKVTDDACKLYKAWT